MVALGLDPARHGGRDGRHRSVVVALEQAGLVVQFLGVEDQAAVGRE